MATSLIQRHKLKIKTRATKNLSAAIQQTKCSDCLQRLDSWDGCRAHPALCYSSNIDCWNDQISRNIPEKDRLGVTKSWEYQNMLKEELNSPNCNNSLLLINNHCLTKTWPALLSHVTRVTWHMSRAGRDRGERDTVSLASLLDAHWLLILESSWSVTKLRDGGVTCQRGTCCRYHRCSQHNLGSGTICIVVNASKCHHYFIEEDKYLTSAVLCDKCNVSWWWD